MTVVTYPLPWNGYVDGERRVRPDGTYDLLWTVRREMGCRHISAANLARELQRNQVWPWDKMTSKVLRRRIARLFEREEFERVRCRRAT